METPPNQHKALRVGPDTGLKMNAQTLVTIIIATAGAVIWATTMHLELKRVSDDVAFIKSMLQVQTGMKKEGG
jgi:hypothetical protein